MIKGTCKTNGQLRGKYTPSLTDLARRVVRQEAGKISGCFNFRLACPNMFLFVVFVVVVVVVVLFCFFLFCFVV